MPDAPLAPQDDCILWTGYVGRNGYGQFSRSTAAHRRAYELAYGPIPEGHDIHHTCHVKTCVNPDHLRALTRVGHIQTSPVVQKEVCANGHRYDAIGMTKEGYVRRRCKVCDRDRANAAYRSDPQKFRDRKRAEYYAKRNREVPT